MLFFTSVMFIPKIALHDGSMSTDLQNDNVWIMLSVHSIFLFRLSVYLSTIFIFYHVVG